MLNGYEYALILIPILIIITLGVVWITIKLIKAILKEFRKQLTLKRTQLPSWVFLIDKYCLQYINLIAR